MDINGNLDVQQNYVSGALHPAGANPAVFGDGQVYYNTGVKVLNIVRNSVWDILAGLSVGTIIDWTTDSVPYGFLYCNGAAISRTTYAALFSVLGTYYGPGDGSTTFNLPYYMGLFSRHPDNGSGRDPDGVARVVGGLQADAIVAHVHYAMYGTAPIYLAGGAIGGAQITTTTVTTTTVGALQTAPVNMYTMPVIKY